MLPIRFMFGFVLGLLFVMHSLIDSSAHAYQGGKEGLGVGGIRKLMAYKELKSREIVRDDGPNGGTRSSEISGKERKAPNDTLGRSQEKLDAQDISAKQKLIAQASNSSKETGSNHQETDETRRLLEAAKEIVSLMHKDYKGMGRRKPPINNHEPSH